MSDGGGSYALNTKFQITASHYSPMRADAHPNLNFGALLRRLEPSDTELSAARKHVMTVRRRLATSFEVVKVMPIGSHRRRTAIATYSDFDLMVVLRRDAAKWGGNLIMSSTLLNKVRSDLQDRYVRTDVRADQQAVVIGFASGQKPLDVVPALFLRFNNGRPVYAIPDGSGDWLESSPEAHNAYFAATEERSGNKLSRTTRLMKCWKYSRARPVPLLSFHLDMLLAASDICLGVKSYPQIVYEAFRLLDDRECRALRDPVGIAGAIYAARTEAQWEELSKAVAYGLYHSRAALLAQQARDFSEANRQWDIVFNGLL
jgi:hypothetical protein